MVEITSPAQGLIGYLHEVEHAAPDSLLVFQLPRATEQMNDSYIQNARKMLASAIGNTRPTLIIGCDVNIYELTGADASILKLKGLI